MDKVVLTDKLAQIHETWKPHVIAELNGQMVKLVKIEGEFVWHHHDDEDELFLVVEGLMRMELRDRVVEVRPGELIVIPQGVEHRPVAEPGTAILLFEPASTLNTGNVRNERTVEVLKHL
jgi:mannose-6-phosphate isomerase-like protein (cupin superfamily)